MIPQPRNWKVTFHTEQGNKSVVVCCVKRFALSIANEMLGYPANSSHKITVGLVK